MEVEAAGRASRHDELFGRVVASDDAEAFRAALGRADHVLDALPLTTATRGLFDAGAFAAMQPTARFFNVGRGATVDEPALVDALERAAIAGAAPRRVRGGAAAGGQPVVGDAPGLLSPHMCGDVEGWEAEVVELFVDNLRGSRAASRCGTVVDTSRRVRGRLIVSGMAERVIEVAGLRKSYGDVEAVRGIDLTRRPG